MRPMIASLAAMLLASAERDRQSSRPGRDLRPFVAVSVALALLVVVRRPRRRRCIAAAERDLRGGGRDIVIVTTAALPWFTGTSVNPLLRAVYLAKERHRVTLVVPWLENAADQRRLFADGMSFERQEDQAEVIRKWVSDLGEGVEIGVRFYEGVYSDELGSIMPVGDITGMFGKGGDVCVLEEPEHLTWHHTGENWTSLFRLVVGIVHTNYLEYAKKHGLFGPQRAFLLRYLNIWVCKCYCHRIIKLSDAVQSLPHSVTCNVHGVRQRFIDIGVRRAREHASFDKGAYFLGKVLWAKGYRQLVDLLDKHRSREGEPLPIDFFGKGPDLHAVKSRVASSPGLARVRVHGVYVDHASEFLHGYKVCVNPSKSDVVCTVTAEALAMGKFVICLEHPSNQFFATFDNCLTYRSPKEFSERFAYALSHSPAPLSAEDAYRLSWQAATERFYEAVLCPPLNRAPSNFEKALAATHTTLSCLITPPASKIKRAKSRGRSGTKESSSSRIDEDVNSTRVPSAS